MNYPYLYGCRLRDFSDPHSAGVMFKFVLNNLTSYRMKNISLILVLLLASTTVVLAQERSDLMGPEYKNYKSWEHESSPTTVGVEFNKEQLTGPEYKNKKAWKASATDKEYILVTVGSERSKLTGPAYKNFKPWRKNN